MIAEQPETAPAKVRNNKVRLTDLQPDESEFIEYVRLSVYRGPIHYRISLCRRGTDMGSVNRAAGLVEAKSYLRRLEHNL